MPGLLAFCKWLEQTAVGAAIRESLWLFPAIETMHLLGMAALVGTVGVLDLRLLGWLMRRERVKMLLIFLAGVHALVFHWIVNRDVGSWDDRAVLPVKARVSGLVSILIWVGIVAAGRFIGFV